MAGLDPIYKQLAAVMKMENSEIMQKILAKLATPEQAKIALELPKPSGEIAQKLNLSKETVDKHIKEMVEKGLVVVTRKGPIMARSEGQLHDLQTNQKFDKELGPEYFALWRQLLKELSVERRKQRIARQGPPTGRIIPRLNSVKDIPGILPFEDVREILKAHTPVAVVHCACKRINDNRECGIPDESCIIFGRTAEFNLRDRKCARELSYDEAMEIINKYDKEMVIHLVPNLRDVGILLCNCHSDCCDVLRPWLDENGKISAEWRKTHAPSRFVAVIEPEGCRSCQLCVKRCQFGAAQMKSYPGLDKPRAYIDAAMCMGCGSCVVTCPAKTRSMKLIRPPEHVPAELGHVFWDNTGT
jgi:ferredoxin/DNA-binding MarR family transcriptional regulator